MCRVPKVAFSSGVANVLRLPRRDQDDHHGREHADDHAEQHQQRGRPEQYLHGSYLTRRDSRRSASGRPPV